MRTHERRHVSGALLSITLACSMLAALLGVTPASGGPRSVGKVSTEQLIRAGTVTLRDLPVERGGIGRGPRFAPSVELNKTTGASSGETLPPPSPRNTGVVVSPVAAGFEGISHLDQRLAGGGNQFSLEPPDQGLCVGRAGGVTFVVESVNDALSVYGATGQLRLGPVTLSQFYGFPPTINRTTGKFGPFVSDPKCYFDTDTKRWFHSALVIGQNPATGAFTNEAFTALAVSKSSNPLGSYFLYKIDATDPNHPSCPCFGDQPLIGADKFGFYVSTAEYDLRPFGAAFNGPQLYATSKAALESGSPGPLVHFSELTDQSGTLQPATSPNGVYESGQGGTEYFESGRDTLPPDGRLRPGQVDEITVWALTNTSSLTGAAPAVNLLRKDIGTEVYGQPVAMTQKDGPRPLGTDPTVNEPLSKVQANDERMNQVVFAAGHLFSGVNTIVAPGPRTGIAWFIVQPSVAGGSLTASVSRQGYFAASNANVSFPSIGVNGSGDGVVVMSLMGPNFFPSAAYVRIDLTGAHGSIRVARSGLLPEDGFTCYIVFVGDNVCRWGDYSASVAGPGGKIWSATEYINDAPRTFFANWNTFIWPVTP